MARKQLHKLDRFAVHEFDSKLRSVLRPGERVLWKGRPRRRLDFSGFGLWLFAVPWTAFSIFWTASAFMITQSSREEAGAMGLVSYLFPLFGLPFILIGLAMMAGPLFALTMPGRTLHAVTDQRVLRLTAGWGSSLREIPALAIIDVRAKPRQDGSGTLVLDLHRAYSTIHSGSAQRSSIKTRTLIRAVPNVRAAMRAVERMRISSAASSQI